MLALANGLRRKSRGGAWLASAKAELKRRRLWKPEASATSVIGSAVSVSSCLANNRRWVAWTAIGGAPRCLTNRRRSCRAPTSSRAARSSRDCSARKPSWISFSPRPTRCSPCSQIVLPGASSGRQRRQGRKPKASAAAALGVVLHILDLGRTCRADGTAIDTGAEDRGGKRPRRSAHRGSGGPFRRYRPRGMRKQ